MDNKAKYFVERLWRMGITNVSVDIVISKNFGENCFSKVVGEKDKVTDVN